MNPDGYAQIARETEAAVNKGLDNANVRWREMAMRSLYEMCLERDVFTANDVRGRIERSPLKTHDRRAMGGIMRTGKKLGWMQKTGRSITSRVGHLSPLQIWESQLYVKPNEDRLPL